jgi:hypothetical protein
MSEHPDGRSEKTIFEAGGPSDLEYQRRELLSEETHPLSAFPFPRFRPPAGGVPEAEGGVHGIRDAGWGSCLPCQKP